MSEIAFRNLAKRGTALLQCERSFNHVSLTSNIRRHTNNRVGQSISVSVMPHIVAMDLVEVGTETVGVPPPQFIDNRNIQRSELL